MDYEKTPITNKVSGHAIKKEKANQIEKFDTSTLLWHIVKRHKFGLVVFYAITISVFYFVPFLPDLLLSLVFGR